MGFVLFNLLILLAVFLNCPDTGSAGVTSRFIRSEFPSTDIPIDNEAFAVPDGHNAPQQVSTAAISLDLLKYYCQITRRCEVMLTYIIGSKRNW